MNKVYN